MYKTRTWAAVKPQLLRVGRRRRNGIWLGKKPAAVYAAVCARLREGRGEERHFSEGVNFYKLVWLYVLGGFIGFCVEVVWCYHIYHRIEWHSAMAFTPFNPIYGAGCVVLYLTLRKAKPRHLIPVFFVAALAGTLIELICSYLQETLFHSYSWDYCHLPYNFEGRICLGMTLGWGALGVAWVLFLCPLLEGIIARIPQKTGKRVVAALAAVVAVDAVITVAAMLRWVARRAGGAPATFIGALLDYFFPDARMNFLFPRIKFFK